MRSTFVLSFQTSLSKIWICAKDKGKPWASAENVGGLALIQALQMASNAPILHISNPVPCQNILNIRWFKIHIDDKNVRKAKKTLPLPLLAICWHSLIIFPISALPAYPIFVSSDVTESDQCAHWHMCLSASQSWSHWIILWRKISNGDPPPHQHSRQHKEGSSLPF